MRIGVSDSTQRGQSDEALWNQAVGGDNEAFGVVYRRHARAAHGAAARICGTGAAEDVVQAAFLALWRNRDSFDPARGNMRAWILGVVRHRAIDSVRAQRRSRMHEHLGDEGVPDPVEPTRTDTQAAARESEQAVRDAVSTLPERQRQVIELAYFRDLSQSAIAAKLGIPLGTVKGRTRLAFERLPERLEPHRGSVPAAA